MELEEAIERVRELEWAYTGFEAQGENVRRYAQALRIVCDAGGTESMSSGQDAGGRRYGLTPGRAIKARDVLEKILDDSRRLDMLGVAETLAFGIGAELLEDSAKRNVHFQRAAIIMRYHATYPLAVVMQDAYTREAISRAIHCITLFIERSCEGTGRE